MKKNSKIKWYSSLASGYASKFGKKLGIKRNVKKKYAGKRLLDRNECANSIISRLESDSPFMVCRYGGDELNVTVAVDAYINNISRSRLKKYHKKRLIYYSAGVFPENEDILLRFGKEMIEDSSEMDILGVWYNIMEDYAIEKFGSPNVQLTGLNSLEPWYLPTRACSHKCLQTTKKSV